MYQIFKYTLYTISLIVLFSCASSPILNNISAKPYPQVYKDAVTDALNPEPSEIVNSLFAINKQNKELTWKMINNKAYVLMVSYNSATYYIDKNTGKAITTLYPLNGYDLWLTASPQLKHNAKVKGLSGNALKTRLNQLIGLSPITDAEKIGGSKERSLIEFWVKAEDMFRPAADFEIDDKEAGLILANAVPSWYRLWFNTIRSKQYFHSFSPKNGAYPWTQLGYTYDWGSKNHVGLSEYVAKGSSSVYIKAIYSTDDYFKQ